MRRGVQKICDWFSLRGWKPFEFQIAVWNAYLEGKSGLIHSATGTGKTFAAWMGALVESLEEESPDNSTPPALRVLWITPLRALAADTVESLLLPVEELGANWRVEMRSGDTASALRARQDERMPTALVTTPESLSVMMSRQGFDELMHTVRLVVVDEWHELMSTKRGVQTELALAHLRTLAPDLRVWGVSATLGNLQEAMDALLGVSVDREPGILIEGKLDKQVIIDTLLPENISRFPWAGHLGAQMVGPVIQAIEESGTCLLFTNTRSHAEIWFQQILEARPDWANEVALHHGSLDREVRDSVENGLKQGLLRAVVCTSSLDLGVDFSPVDRVLQLGSPKGAARLLQRAGRSGHRPGVVSRVTGVPTHAFELVDMAAAREAVLAGKIEKREGLDKPLDVLAQHLVTVAAGEGFRSNELFEEVRTSYAYRNLSEAEWSWVLEFVTSGGASLKAYPEYHRVVLLDGLYRVPDIHLARRHRMGIGTIVSDSATTVQYLTGGKLGTVEESFVARLKKGDKFLFAGKALEFVRMKDMTAWVKRATNLSGAVPRWMGGRLPLSGELANAIRDELEHAKNGELRSPEMRALGPVLEVQANWSAIPASDELLVESVHDREGHHLFFYPFEGRLVHQGLAALFAFRIARHQPMTFSMASNDYGFELLSSEEAPLEEAISSGLLSPQNLAIDIVTSLNSAELARRQFREVARVAGLIFQGFPGAGKTARQLQASSGLFYDVFARFDPENLLLHQSHKEVLDQQLEQTRMRRALARLESSRLLLTHPKRPTPLAFPILVDRLRETLSTEAAPDRIQKLALRLETEAAS